MSTRLRMLACLAFVLLTSNYLVAQTQPGGDDPKCPEAPAYCEEQIDCEDMGNYPRCNTCATTPLGDICVYVIP